jgi:hypothetical protein
MNNEIWTIQLMQLEKCNPILAIARINSYRQYEINTAKRSHIVECIFEKYPSGKVSIYENGIGVYIYP